MFPAVIVLSISMLYCAMHFYFFSNLHCFMCVVYMYHDEGIHEKVDYLKDNLHVDAVCIGPLNPTPNLNYGYNIMNYNAIDENHYGSMEDFEKLRVALHKKSISMFLTLLYF